MHPARRRSIDAALAWQDRAPALRDSALPARCVRLPEPGTMADDARLRWYGEPKPPALPSARSTKLGLLPASRRLHRALRSARIRLHGDVAMA